MHPPIEACSLESVACDDGFTDKSRKLRSEEEVVSDDRVFNKRLYSRVVKDRTFDYGLSNKSGKPWRIKKIVWSELVMVSTSVVGARTCDNG
jgi:hypothetical protein